MKLDKHKERIIKDLENKDLRSINGHLFYAIGAAPELVEPILLAGADINCKRDTPPHYPILCAIMDKPELVELLLKYKANPNVQDKEGKNALMLAICYEKSKFCIPQLIKAGAEINQADKYGETPLIYAIKIRSELVDYFLDLGCEFNVINEAGNTPLYIAMERSSSSVQALLNKGALVNSNNCYGTTPLMNAIVNAPQFVSELIKRGADIQAKSKKGENALNYAIKYNIEIAKELIDCGIEINHFNKEAENPLMLAVEKNPAIIPKLIENGADLYKENIYNTSALHVFFNREDKNLWKTIFSCNHKIKEEVLRELFFKENHPEIKILLEKEILKINGRNEKISSKIKL